MNRFSARFFGFAALSLSILGAFAPGISRAATTPLFTPLYDFTYPNGSQLRNPLVQGSDGNFYGTARQGGAFGFGTVYQLTPAGTLTTVHSFSDSDGAEPEGSLIQGSDGNLYGTTNEGGSSGEGTVFKLTLSGTLTTLYSFTGGNDGGNPYAGLVEGKDGNFYGTTWTGGSSVYYGTVFKITSSGTLTTLHSFSDSGSDGASPEGILIQGSDGDFYGTTEQGGSSTNSGYGTVFKITPSGTLTTIFSFTGNSDGEFPNAGLLQGSDGNFYGTIPYSGADGEGTVFRITPSGTLTTLVTFIGTNGDEPNGPLIQGKDGNFYGTTVDGPYQSGTVFKITPAGTLTTLAGFNDMNGPYPISSLLQGNDGNFYGTTEQSDYSGGGMVFKLTPSGTLTTLASFILSDGSYPVGSLVQGSDGNFYGTTEQGGSSGAGTVFKITPAGTLTTLHNFSATNSFSGMSTGTNADGAIPYDALVQGANGNFYGTTSTGGSSAYGTVFSITPSGALTTLVNFDASNGAFPTSSLVLGSDGNFYGTTVEGGASVPGTVFKLTPAGTLTTLYNFSATSGSMNTVNSDGASPYAALIQGSDGNFYGTAYYGGSSGTGTVFKLTPAGTLTTLHSFSVLTNNENSDGSNPYAGLVQGSDGNFYGTTYEGGTSGEGTVFKITSSGVFTTLVDFTSTTGSFANGSLVQGRDGDFYGTTSSGGISGAGTVFKITPMGSLTTLYSFSARSSTFPNGNSDGDLPHAALILGSDGSFYGTTEGGGSSNAGTIFRVNPAAVSITSFSPTVGAVGTHVAITGINFTGTTAVSFNGTAAAYAVNSDTQITAVVPSGATTGNIAVTAPGGTVTSSGIFEVAPAITSFTPTSGPVGTVITVIGTNLNGVTAVRFHNANATMFSVNAQGTQLTVTVPSSALTGTIKVTTSSGSVTSSQTFTATSSPPAVTSFTPTSGPVGTVVTVTGTNLNGVTAVRFHNASATAFSANATGTQLTVIVPSGALTGTLTITTPVGSVQTTGQFTVTSMPPTVTSFTPASGPAGTVVTVTGTNLNGVTAVWFHDASAMTFSANAQGTQLTVTVPSGALTGTLTITTPGGSVQTAAQFTVN